ncbi:MAG: DUF2851 family protein [Alistipes sp.]|nr:DUF2851 family protein [Alistipes sp.]
MAAGQHTIESLRHGARRQECCVHIQNVDALELNVILNRLTCERLDRKARDIMRTFKATGESWNECFHTMLLGVLGGMDNRAPMLRLAERVTNNMLMRENSSIVKLEALLLGGAGLLDIYGDDDYLRLLREEFSHLAAKYGIVPMMAGEWQLTGIYPHNHPTLRLTQLAACFLNRDFTLQSALECRTSDAIYKFFGGETSDYWLTNFIPVNSHSVTTYRMGHIKSDLLGINLIAPMMHAYSAYTRNSNTANDAIRLLESIAAESNRLTKPWTGAGLTIRNAFESQALIQLSKEYCSTLGCERCPLGKCLLSGI